MMNDGPQGDKSWLLPSEPQGSSAPPKSAPGEGLKAFASSGALQAFHDPQGAKQEADVGPHLMNFLKMFQGSPGL